jgi:Type II secretory pathway, ATPase PulE/Tfp pilus assembly pathway, ATPase PilB
MLPITEKIHALILEGSNTMQMAKLTKQKDINDLKTSRLLKVKQNITSLEEIDRVTKE